MSSLADQLLGYSSDEEPVEEVKDEVSEEVGNVNLNLTHIEDITKYSQLETKLEPVIAKLDSTTEFEHDFVIEANGYVQEIRTEIATIHNFIKIHYNSVFPELDSLISTPLEYAKTVRLLGIDIVKSVATHEEDLKAFLPKEKLLVITMSTSLRQSDYDLPDFTNIAKACDLVIRLSMYQQRLIDFVSSNLARFAPNLSQLIGPYTTVQLISSTGSLANLASTPSCNLAALGNKRHLGTGYGSTGVKFEGFIYDNEFISEVPQDFKKQAIRMLTAKITLCARVDLAKSSLDGSLGLKYKEEVVTKLEKLMAPPEQSKIKAMPVPIDHKSKKRGGRRITKMKKNFEMSDLQKLQNRMAFGEKEESYVDSYGEEIGMGLAAKSQVGNIRIQSRNSGPKLRLDKKTAAKLAKTYDDDDILNTNGQLQPTGTKLLEQEKGRWFSDIPKRKLELEDGQSKRMKK